jgi:nucleotide-binding universal stress UspA family protein
MQEIKQILYPTDFSERSQLGYHYCLELAKQFGATVHVLHVNRIDFGVPMNDTIAYKIIEERQKLVQAKLEHFAMLEDSDKQALKEGVEIKTYALAGIAEEEIIAFSKSEAIDLIVMPTKGEHNLLESMFGSVTTAVSAVAPCPILILPEKAVYRPIKDIAYATDFSEENTANLQTVLDVVGFFQTRLHLVHVYQKERATIAELRKIIEEVSDNQMVAYHELQGDTVPKGIDNFLQEQEVDLLMAYSPSKNFFERLFRLGTTRHLLHQVTCPLMIIH